MKSLGSMPPKCGALASERSCSSRSTMKDMILCEVGEPDGCAPGTAIEAGFAAAATASLANAQRRLESLRVAIAVLQEQRGTVAPGETFGASGQSRVRMSLTTSIEMVAEGCERILVFARRRAV